MALTSVCRVLLLVTLYLLIEGATAGPWYVDLRTQLDALGSSLSGNILVKGSSGYDAALAVCNLHWKKHPGAIVYPLSVDDVKKTVQFARTHNVTMSVRSSGHSFIGRSTADDSLQINFANMKNATVNTNDSSSDTGASATVESGCPMGDLYREVHKYGLLAVGGSTHSVATGGYTLGGGHSPMTRTLGLGVDSVLEITMVTADGRIVVATATGTSITAVDGTTSSNSNTDLFWALRGGGGAFGVVVSFKIKLHQPPSSFVHYLAFFPMRLPGAGNVGEKFLNFYTDLLKTEMSDRWSGYLLTNNRPTPVIPGSSVTVDGVLTLSLLHFGPWEEAQGIVGKLYAWNPSWRTAIVKNVSTFWDYEKDINDPFGYYAYIFNRLIQPDDLGKDFSEMMGAAIMNSEAPLWCTATHIGGQTTRNPPVPSAATDKLRTGILSLTCNTAWEFDYQRAWVLEKAGDFRKRFYKFGEGAYYNEPDYCLDEWKTEFWGTNYNRLLQIKQQWDPNNVFTCRNCVGSRQTRDPDAPCSGNRIGLMMGVTQLFIFAVISIF